MILVVGASASGLSVVEALRRNDFAGRIGLVGEEPQLPYDRPPLSKQVLAGEWVPERTALRQPEQVRALDVELRLGQRATGVDLENHAVDLADGSRIRYDTLVVATGLTPRQLPGQQGLHGVHQIHKLDDSLALRQELLTARQVAVIGAGVLGCEIAATARGLGREVTLIDPATTPMFRQIGPWLGGLVGEMQTRQGVRLLTNTSVLGLESEQGRVTGVRVGRNTVVPADVVVVAIGGVPATGWLASSGLRIENGVVCDSQCRAAADVYAVGDVASFHHVDYDTRMRLENRTNATEQGIFVAAAIAGSDRPYRPVPYFWTDQYENRIQVHGIVPPDAAVRVVEGLPADDKFVAVAESKGRVAAAIGWNHPRGVRSLRPLVLDGMTASTQPR
ncbi:NAD(P)/FAD-dependent oxidoreductase [Actinoplanes sp. NPDC049265]|uniref:NAD(P)/FAD-dependent oxidoreductase n=1 Tax=Actinoplanes sp. NPDC049265 TaxID=3363902 RepID=UPI0037232ED7